MRRVICLLVCLTLIAPGLAVASPGDALSISNFYLSNSPGTVPELATALNVPEPVVLAMGGMVVSYFEASGSRLYKTHLPALISAFHRHLVNNDELAQFLAAVNAATVYGSSSYLSVVDFWPVFGFATPSESYWADHPNDATHISGQVPNWSGSLTHSNATALESEAFRRFIMSENSALKRAGTATSTLQSFRYAYSSTHKCMICGTTWSNRSFDFTSTQNVIDTTMLGYIKHVIAHPEARIVSDGSFIAPDLSGLSVPAVISWPALGPYGLINSYTDPVPVVLPPDFQLDRGRIGQIADDLTDSANEYESGNLIERGWGKLLAGLAAILDWLADLPAMVRNWFAPDSGYVRYKVSGTLNSAIEAEEGNGGALGLLSVFNQLRDSLGARE
jgi:hypothetical protein